MNLSNVDTFQSVALELRILGDEVRLIDVIKVTINMFELIPGKVLGQCKSPTPQTRKTNPFSIHAIDAHFTILSIACEVGKSYESSTSFLAS